MIFRNEMTANQVLGGGILSFSMATLLGIVLIFLVGPVIILFGLIGMLIAYFYSAKPFKLASRGLGCSWPTSSDQGRCIQDVASEGSPNRRF